MDPSPLNLVLGRYDAPENQTQGDYYIDLHKSNLAIFGLAMSGKTTLLKTLLIRLHQVAGVTDKEEVFILDFSNDLQHYKSLPYVVAYFDTSQEENIRRIFNKVEEHYTYNVSRLPGKTYTQCESDPNRPPHVTFILDGLNAFLSEERYTTYHDILRKLARDGLAKGISIVFTASDTTDGVNKFLSSFGSIIALDLPKDKYKELFNAKIEKPISVEGRGIVNFDRNVYEFQAYFPYNAIKMKDEIAVQELEKQLRSCPAPNGYKSTADEIIDSCIMKKMRSFTKELTRDQWELYTGISWEKFRKYPTCGKTDLVVGLDYYNFTPVKFDLLTAQSIAIYGRRSFGKSNLLGLILETALAIPDVRFVIWEDGRKGLSKNAEAVKHFLDEASRSKRVKSFNKRKEFEEFLQTDYKGEFLPPTSKHSMFDIEQPTSKANDSAVKFFRSSENNVSTPEHSPSSRKPNPFTIFIIQSREFYQTAGIKYSDQIIPRLSSFINTNNESNKKLFIFSDVQPIVDNECNTSFNNCISHAFLLNDMLRFINDRGQKSVFGGLDIEDIKERFGKCALGDGFYYDLDGGELQKLRFLKQSEISG